MQLRYCLLPSVLFAAALASATEYRQQPAAEKNQAPDLTFAVSFDQYKTAADVSGGNPVSRTLPDLDLRLRGNIGFDTEQAFLPQPGEELKFDVPGNVDPHQGTVTLWVCAQDYNPADELTDGRHRGNIGLVRLYFNDGKRCIDFKLYEYGNAAWLFWDSSEKPAGIGGYSSVSAPLDGIRQGQWYQLAFTYDADGIAIFLNGELTQKAPHTAKAAKTVDLRPENTGSYLGIRSEVYGDNEPNDRKTAIDDVKIYSRALHPLEIRENYRQLLTDAAQMPPKYFELAVNGVDEGGGTPLDQAEAALDFSCLPEGDRARIGLEELTVEYTLTAPDGMRRRGNWLIRELKAFPRLDGITEPGLHHLQVTLELTNGQTVAQDIDFTVPDLAFAGNGIGSEDTVPELWRDFKVEERRITLWNRIYEFGAGPLPEQITVHGQPLLAQAPRLVIHTGNGVEEIVYSAGPTESSNSSVTFTGHGQAAGFGVEYATTVEFDGMIKFDFTITGEPEVRSMALAWQVDPAFCQFLLAPLLQQSPDGKFAFPYPTACFETVTQLWLAAEKTGGFAYTMVNDANWVYTPGENVFEVDRNTGSCEVKMITRPVAMPAATPYQALFIATPTRPLPEKNRVIRHGDRSRGDTMRLEMAGGAAGLTGHMTFKPHPAAFSYQMKHLWPGTASIFGASNALTTREPAANYFREYWNTPGEFVYKMPYAVPGETPGEYTLEYNLTVPACNATHIKDFYLWNILELLLHPYGDRVAMIYYDLSLNELCGNPRHGCSYRDRFGRRIDSFVVLHQRDLYKRTVRLCHAMNRTVMLHAQRHYSPFMHGLADYWFPGEQHSGLLHRNPFGYADELSDALYRSEYNRDVLGSGVVFLTALGAAKPEYAADPKYAPYTEALLTMLLAHDIDADLSFTLPGPQQRVWDILERYRVGAPETECRRFYEQSEIPSDNPAVRVTYYQTPTGLLFIAANPGKEPAATVIDLNQVATGDYELTEEYTGQPATVSGGKLKLTVPGRSFRIFGIPQLPEFPLRDDFSRPWLRWQSDASKGVISLEPGALQIACDATADLNNSFCVQKNIQVRPGQSYTATVQVEHRSPSAEAVPYLAFQFHDENGLLSDLEMPKVSLPPGGGKKELRLHFQLPQDAPWQQVTRMLVTLGITRGNGDIVRFSGFQLEDQ